MEKMVSQRPQSGKCNTLAIEFLKLNYAATVNHTVKLHNFRFTACDVAHHLTQIASVKTIEQRTCRNRANFKSINKHPQTKFASTTSADEIVIPPGKRFEVA